ncbi:MAG TPA: tellurite resistance TerB C-terminal domain-containing protein [Ktedonobacteraceae bacterium]|nr:tellurite resistance TerB C-terminal domain-containing protein [Ktedonobacteraceae bacterium]
MVISNNSPGKPHSSPLAFLFPWLSPLSINFVLVDGGIKVQLQRNNQLLQNWQPSKLRHVLPETLAQWMNDHHIFVDPQPYPLVKQLWQQLIPLASKKLLIDASALAELEETRQPQDFMLVWMVNRSLACIEGRFEGADRYLGMGWFQKGKNVWSLNNSPPAAIDSQLKNLTMPPQQAGFLLNSIIPYLQQYLPTRADFQLITDFRLQVTVLGGQGKTLVLTLQCNYPQLLPTIQIPDKPTDALLANQAIIQFPQQALTPVMAQLLRNGSSIALQGTDIPLFIREQLSIMHRYQQISNDTAAKIMQTHPVVPITSLQPTLSLTHTSAYGIGQYRMIAVYRHQLHTIDMAPLLVAHRLQQRFVQQHGIWFEWPYDSGNLAHTIQQLQAAQIVLPGEVMGFHMQRLASIHIQPPAPTIQPEGTTLVERGQSVFKQLRHHGIPGGIIGEPPRTAAMFVDACEQLVRDNPEAGILWLVPWRKKSSVTRAVNSSPCRSSIQVASPAALYHEPSLTTQSWTLVIFQAVDLLLLENIPLATLSRLNWRWALASVTSKEALHSSIMPILHLSEQWYGQFCPRYLFDLSKISHSQTAVSNRDIARPPSSPAPVTPSPAISMQYNPATRRPPVHPAANIPARPPTTPSYERPASPPIRHTIELNQQAIVHAHQEAAQLQDRLTMEKQQLEPAPPKIAPANVPPTIRREPTKIIPEPVKPPPPPKKQPVIQLNQEAILKLHAESEQLQDRLSIVTMEHPAIILITEPPAPEPEQPAVGETQGSPPDVDEDWQVILQQWKPEHWEVIQLLYQEQHERLSEVERKIHRPVSRLIDEINEPVDEQLGDLLVDPDTQALSPHLHTVAESLVSWYFSSEGR